MRDALRPLRLPAFAQLAGSYLVNELGNWLGEVALAVLVFDATGSALATAALFVAMQFVPALVGPPLVARLELAGSRRSLVTIYFCEAAVFAVLGLLAGGELALAAVLALAAIDGSLASAARTLSRASAAELLAPYGLLREGNALLNVGFTAGAAAGPALAGLLIAGAGTQAALFADAASFCAVALLLLGARALPAARTDESGWSQRLARGIRYVRERALLGRLIAAQAAAFVFFALVIPIEVVFAKETLDAGDLGYGVLLASWGTGMVSGSVVFAALGRTSLPILLVASTAAIGLAYLGIAASPTLLVACLASLGGGLGNGVQWVALVTAVQELTGGAYQARVVSLLEASARAMPGVGFIAGGVITTLLSPRASYAIAGAGVLVVLALAVAALRGERWVPAPSPAAPAEEGALRVPGA